MNATAQTTQAGDAVRVHALHKSFGNVHALSGVDLTIPAGSTFGLVGPNGAGKTTLFSIIAGFLRPTMGSVIVLDRPVQDLSLHDSLAVLPQDATWRKGIPVGTQMELCARIQGMNKAQAKQEVVRVLSLTGMEQYINRYPEKLSHGMGKRVAIAQAFIGNPKLILLDEPLAGLDPAQARRIRLLIQQETGKITFIISSHVMADVEALCSHVAIIKEGKIVAQPSMAELTEREAVVVFTLAETPAESLPASFETLAYVSKVELRPVERKLQLSVKIDQKNLDEAVAEFIKVLMEQNVQFVGMQKGTSLEEAVLKIT